MRFPAIKARDLNGLVYRLRDDLPDSTRIVLLVRLEADGALSWQEAAS